MTMSGMSEVIDHGERTRIKLTSEQLCAHRAGSIAIAFALGAFVLVICAVTIVRLGSVALAGADYMRPVEAIGRI
jgi:Flp pilus assembly protein TadG